jgi:hypothetical protein
MIQVTDQEFYHIHRITDNSGNRNKYSDQWQVGNRLDFGQSTNLLHDRIFNPSIDFNYEKEHLKWLLRRYNANGTPTEKRQLQIGFFQESMLFKYLQLAREMTLEEVRLSQFADKPSRLYGIWLSDLDTLKKWSNILPKSRFPQKLFQVTFTGKLHKGDERWITNRSLSFQSYYKNAVGYWQGQPQSKRGKPTTEYVGEGTLTIVKEIM